jgi:hypothetical protein
MGCHNTKQELPSDDKLDRIKQERDSELIIGVYAPHLNQMMEKINERFSNDKMLIMHTEYMNYYEYIFIIKKDNYYKYIEFIQLNTVIWKCDKSILHKLIKGTGLRLYYL